MIHTRRIRYIPVFIPGSDLGFHISNKILPGEIVMIIIQEPGHGDGDIGKPVIFEQLVDLSDLGPDDHVIIDGFLVFREALPAQAVFLVEFIDSPPDPEWELLLLLPYFHAYIQTRYPLIGNPLLVEYDFECSVNHNVDQMLTCEH